MVLEEAVEWVVLAGMVEMAAAEVRAELLQSTFHLVMIQTVLVQPWREALAVLEV